VGLKTRRSFHGESRLNTKPRSRFSSQKQFFLARENTHVLKAKTYRNFAKVLLSNI
jgi:hypothetical protein